MPPTSKEPLEEKLSPRKSRCVLQVGKNLLLPTSPPKPPVMPIDTTTSAYQSSNIEDDPVDVDAVEHDLSIDFEENASHQ